MDLKILCGYTFQQDVNLDIQSDYIEDASKEPMVVKQHKLKNEQIGLIIRGTDGEKRYTTIITDRRLIPIEGNNNKKKSIAWKNIKSIESSCKEIIFKTGSGHKRYLPIKHLTEPGDDVNETGKLIVNLLKKRFNI